MGRYGTNRFVPAPVEDPTMIHRLAASLAAFALLMTLAVPVLAGG